MAFSVFCEASQTTLLFLQTELVVAITLLLVKNKQQQLESIQCLRRPRQTPLLESNIRSCTSEGGKDPADSVAKNMLFTQT